MKLVEKMRSAMVKISKFAAVMNQHVYKFSVESSSASIQIINMPSIMNAKVRKDRFVEILNIT